MNAVTLIGMAYVFCLVAIVGFARKIDEKRKFSFEKLKRQYTSIRTRRMDYEFRHGDEYAACDNPHYQALLQQEAGILISMMMEFPDETKHLENEVRDLVRKINDPIIQ